MQAEIGKLIPTPRLYRVTMNDHRQGTPGVMEMCMGAEALQQRIAEVAEHPPAPRAPEPGCTSTRHKNPDGSFHAERRCDTAKGAARNSLSTTDGTIADMRQHTETNGRVRDAHMVYLGACPADMKQGQVRGPDGVVADPRERLAALRAQAKLLQDKGGAR